eukprot:1160983-Pelagomonas_calceolata.AAC.5
MQSNESNTAAGEHGQLLRTVTWLEDTRDAICQGCHIFGPYIPVLALGPAPEVACGQAAAWWVLGVVGLERAQHTGTLLVHGWLDEPV